MLCLNTQECCFFILVNHALNIRWKTHFCGHWKIIAGRWSKHFELIIKQYIFLSFFFRFMYDILPVSMPFSPIIPPSPSPTESKRLFYTSVSISNFLHWKTWMHVLLTCNVNKGISRNSACPSHLILIQFSLVAIQSKCLNDALTGTRQNLLENNLKNYGNLTCRIVITSFLKSFQ